MGPHRAHTTSSHSSQLVALCLHADKADRSLETTESLHEPLPSPKESSKWVCSFLALEI